MAQRITRLTTNQEIAGSNPVTVGKFFSTLFSAFGNFRPTLVYSDHKLDCSGQIAGRFSVCTNYM